MDMQAQHDATAPYAPRFYPDFLAIHGAFAVCPIATLKATEHLDTQNHRPSRSDSASSCFVPKHDSHTVVVGHGPVSAGCRAKSAREPSRLIRDKPLFRVPGEGRLSRKLAQCVNRPNVHQEIQHQSSVNPWLPIDRTLWLDHDDWSLSWCPVRWVECWRKFRAQMQRGLRLLLLPTNENKIPSWI